MEETTAIRPTTDEPRPVRRVRSELNLEQWSIWLPSNSNRDPAPRVLTREIIGENGQKVKAEVEIAASRKGTLTTEDQRTYYALVEHHQRNQRGDHMVYFSLRGIAKSMAVDAEILESNACRRVKKLKLDNQRTRVLSDEEEVKLLAALDQNDPLRQMVTLALHTGLRRGEIFNLAWDDVDFKRRMIIVQQSKSGKKRFVPMNATVAEMLKNAVRRGELVFPSPITGGKLVEIKRAFGTALKDAGIENLRFHDLRHTAATRMADAGADGFTLMKILGHSDIRMTSRYTHATDSSLRKAVENLDRKEDFRHVLGTEQKTASANLPQVLDFIGAGEGT